LLLKGLKTLQGGELLLKNREMRETVGNVFSKSCKQLVNVAISCRILRKSPRLAQAIWNKMVKAPSLFLLLVLVEASLQGHGVLSSHHNAFGNK
jgi:hypothetical protein